MPDEKKEGGLGSLGGLFGAKKEGSKGMGDIGGAFFGKHEETQSLQMGDLSSQMNNLSRRLKMIEERTSNMRNTMQLTDANLLEFNKETNRNMKMIHAELLELKRDFNDLKEKTKLIVKELKDTAKNDDVKLLERYINLWEPVNFVTKKDVERIVEDKLSELSQGNIIEKGRGND